MMLEIEERTDGALRLGPSSLYYSLSRLEASGLIEEKDGVDTADEVHGERRRYYTLTRRGRQRLKDELDVLSSVMRHARAAGVLAGGR
jgi:DNA-binding PadR family transcriptional regulator